MQKKLRQEHNLKVPRDLVYAVMSDIDPNGLEARAIGNARKKEKRKVHNKGSIPWLDMTS